MRVSFSLAVALAIGVSTAAYADGYGPRSSYTPPYYDWSGIYVGGNGGGGWSDTTFDFKAAGVLLGAHPTGALAGGQVGFNVQRGSWVFGAEYDGDWSGLRDHGVAPVAVDVVTKLHDLQTLTGRLGYAYNNVLVYAKGGWATGEISVNFATGGVPVSEASKRLNGGTVGGGIEYGLTRNIILGVEYDYAHLDGRSFTAPPVVPFSETSLNVQSVVGRISYKFDWGQDRYVPLK